ncbi:MAG: ABC transporter substrate-binding protein [Microthrixaceae bacterium]
MSRSRSTHAGTLVARRAMVLASLSAALVGPACSPRDRVAAEVGPPDIVRPTGTTEVRLGYFASLAHAPAILGLRDGLFARELGATRLIPHEFTAGPEVVQALFADAVDIAYVGANPAVTAYVRSRSGGGALRIVAGSTSGGAALVVRSGIERPADLRGAVLATPQLGNTQDVALRVWLRSQRLHTDSDRADSVRIVPQSNADTFAAFRSGRIDGAWVAEPWVARLVEEGGAKVLVDEASLWRGGRFTSAVVVARTEFLRRHPDAVAAVLRAHLGALRLIGTERGGTAGTPSHVAERVGEGLAAATGERLGRSVLARAWTRLHFGADPLAPTIAQAASDASSVGLLPDHDVRGIEDLRILRLLEAHRPSAERAPR